MIFNRVILNEERKVSLDCYILDDDIIYKAKYRPAVIVIAGGGYTHRSHFEGEPVAINYLNAGYHAFVLNYSVGEYYKKGLPLKDYEDAYEYLESHKDEMHLMMDKIAVCGFSAGGHLASEASLSSVHRPNAAILVYPCTSQETIDRNNIDANPTIDRLDASVPPTFIVTTATDRLVNPDDSLLYASKLVKLGVPAEVHMYYRGNHGFGPGTKKTFVQYGYNLASRIENWMSDSVSWLNEIFNVHTSCARYPWSQEYSVYMSFESLLSNDKSKKILEKECPQVFDDYAFEKGLHYPFICVLEYFDFDKEKIDEIDRLLKELNESTSN